MKGFYQKVFAQLTSNHHSLVLPFSERRLLLFVGDSVGLGIALFLSYWVQSFLYQEVVGLSEMVMGEVVWFFALAALWLGLNVVNEVYDLQTAHQQAQVLRGLLLTLVEVSVLYLLLFFIVGRSAFIVVSLLGEQWQIDVLSMPPRIVAVVFLVLCFLFLSLWRLGYIRITTVLPLRCRALIVGAGRAGRTLVQSLHRPSIQYEFVGFIDDDTSKQGTEVLGLPVVGTHRDLEVQVAATNVHEVILAINNDIQADLLRALMSCYESGIAIKPMAILYEEILERVPVEHLGLHWLPPPFWQTPANLRIYRTLKRFTDLILGFVGLLGFGVLFPLIAVFIYVESPGPIFYVQERLGRAGKPFKLHKFRSMTPNAEQDGIARWATRDDVRITRVGKILRRTRLDELPQIINVLRGDMSIVGPRPERRQFVEQLQEEIPYYRARMAVKPGLTGWAQIKYPYGNTVEDALMKLQYDLYYIKHQSLLLDILIILRTIRVMLTFRGT